MIVRPDLVLARWLQIQREQWLSPDELRHRQWTRFKRVLRHAAQHSPFYRGRFRHEHLTPEDVKDESDLGRIPITTREDLADPDQFVADGRRPSALHHSFSSGSTGQSVKTYFGAEAWLVGKFLLKLRGRLACGVRPWDRLALLQAGAFRNTGFRQLVLRQKSFSIHDAPERIVPELRRFTPTVLYGFPSHFSRLADVPGAGLRPGRIFTSGEMLPRATRGKIERAFGAPVYDVYGCTELKEIAWECLERQGYHVNSDWLLVESLPTPAAGDDCDGTLLVTSLFNDDMPLIRYRLGDTGRLLDTRCSCGRSLPLMAPRFGRSVDYLELPGGRLVSPYTLINELEVLSEVRQFQLIQVEPDLVVAKVVFRGSAGPESRDRVRSTLQPVLPGVRLEVRVVEGIERESSGKYRLVLSRIQTSRS